MTENKSSIFKQHAIGFKGLLVVILVLLMMIPTSMIRGLITERSYRQDEALREVADKWSAEQTLVGPILNIPFRERVKVETSLGAQIQIVDRTAHILPAHLEVESLLNPEKRKRGIFEVAVYRSDISWKGNISIPDKWTKDSSSKEMNWDEAYITFGVSDPRGIEDVGNLLLSGVEYDSDPGTVTNEVISSGFHFPITLPENRRDSMEFSLDLSIKGSKGIFFVPIGEETNVGMTSSWPDPSFGGGFLPDDHEISDDGFVANWKVLQFNRNFPQEWVGGQYSFRDNNDGISVSPNGQFSASHGASSFGVSLILPADHYQKSDRSIKYALLFLALTFMVFFFVEVTNGRFVHPFQYLLVGFALCIFYTLLLSFSEHIGFNAAYLTSAMMTTVLISLYSLSILKSKALALLMGSILVILYGFIFVLLQLQDFALLVGSLGLFLIVAVVMFFSRRIDWYKINSDRGKLPKKETVASEIPGIENVARSRGVEE